MINKNAHKNQKWDHDLRKMLFFMFLQKFGKYTQENKPKAEDIDVVCKEFVKTVNAHYGLDISEDGGPHMQYRWAVTKQDKVEHVAQLMASKMAAYEIGYIDASYLPSTALFEY